LSYWKYAFLKREAFGDFLKALGCFSLGLGLLDTFNIVPKETLPPRLFYVLLGGAFLWVVIDRRPIKRVRYKVPHRDLCIEVRLGDLLASKEDIVVSSNTTFETAISNGPISPKSIQGQVLLRFFDGNTEDLDRQIEASLAGAATVEAIGPGKRLRYPLGTVAKVKAHGKNLYFVAMSELNEHGNAQSDASGVMASLSGLWTFIASRGELGDLAIPVMGTGRGRVTVTQQKMIEAIAQSFADASRERVFARKLAIVVQPDDAKTQEINLFEIRDDLRRRLAA
jgi:hypothetical protein